MLISPALQVVMFSALLVSAVSVQAADNSTSAMRPAHAESGPEEIRAKEATDELDKQEENSQMPLPGQGYGHSSLLLDKAKEHEEIDARLEKLKRDGKIADPKN